MNWYNESDKSRPIITPQAEIYGFLRKRGGIPGFKVHEDFLMFLTGNDLVELQDDMPVRKEEFPLPAFLGKRPIYVVDQGTPISVVGKALSAPVAVDVLEVAIAMGARRLFFFGLCGAVGEHLDIGHMVAPSEITREEGT